MKCWMKENKFVCFIAIACTIYFLFLFPYYRIGFYVPDASLYSSFSKNGAKSADGFSSLFVFFSSLLDWIPETIHLSQILFLAVSIFLLILGVYKLFSYTHTEMLFVIGFTFSCGFWYYFYGKLFYDFPFTAISYSICILLVAKICFNLGLKKRNSDWYCLYIAFGFCLSWKPYNIFLIAGLNLLMLCNKRTREICLTYLQKLKTISLTFLSVIFGFIIGNFNFLFFPDATLNGLTAYKASSSFQGFLLGYGKIIWDHVNSLPFNSSSISILTVLIMLVVLPCVIKKYQYLLCSFFMVFCLYIYITFFSPGYPWHGFPFALFVLTFFFFLVKESQQISLFRKKLFTIAAFIAIGIQFIGNFGFYIPIQAKWSNLTMQSIEILQSEEADIREDVMQCVESMNGTFTIDSTVYRFQPYSTAPLNFKKVSIDNLYFVTDNYIFANPLICANKDAWDEIYQLENYTENQSQYTICILPNPFKAMSEVANIHKYDGLESIITIHRKNYSIYLYTNNEN